MDAGSGLKGPGAGMFSRLEAERTDIAGILHNRIGQSLTACLLAIEPGDMTLDAEVRNDLVAELLDALNSTRELSLRLLVPRFGEGGLVVALESWLDRHRAAGALTYTLAGDQQAIVANQDRAILGFRLIQDGVESLLGLRHTPAVSVFVALRGPEVGLQVDAGVNGPFDSVAWRRQWAGVFDDHAALLRGNGAHCTWSVGGKGVAIALTLPSGD
jgi:signal transduction histidine kinase